MFLALFVFWFLFLSGCSMLPNDEDIINWSVLENEIFIDEELEIDNESWIDWEEWTVDGWDINDIDEVAENEEWVGSDEVSFDIVE